MRPVAMASVFLFFLTFVLPVWIFPGAGGDLEFAKQTLWIFGVSFLAIAHLLRSDFSFRFPRMRFREWAMRVFLFLFLGFFAVSSFLSLDPPLSWLGHSGQAYASFLTAAAGVTIFFLLKKRGALSQKSFFCVARGFGWAGIAVGVHTLVAWFFPSVFSGTFLAQSPIGTPSQTGLFLLCVLFLMWGLGDPKKIRLWRRAEFLVLFFLTLLALVVLDIPTLWVFGLIGLLFHFWRALHADARPASFVSCCWRETVFLFIAVFFILFSSPLKTWAPFEASPDLKQSWQIVAKTWGETSPLFGSGPGTYAFDYAKYHGAEVNATPFWNVRFDRGVSYALTLLPTIGILGTACFFLFLFLLFWQVLRAAWQTDGGAWHSFATLPALAVLTAGFFFFSFSLSLLFCFWIVSGLSSSQTLAPTPSGRVFGFWSPRIFRAVAGVAILTTLFLTAARLGSARAFSAAEGAARRGDSPENVARLLNRSAVWNQWNDAAYRNLANTFSTFLQKESQKDPAAFFADLQKAQSLDRALHAAQTATDLSSENVMNWEVRGNLFAAFAAQVPGADLGAIKAFQKAHALEPMNPAHLTQAGRAYLFFAQRLQKEGDPQGAFDALVKAEDALARALEAKIDYAPAHFVLALVYKEQGRLGDAIRKMESVRRYNPLDVGAAFQLGLLYLESGSLSQARAAFRETIQLFPTFVNAYWFLSVVEERAGNVSEALLLLRTLEDLTGRDPRVLERGNLLRQGNAESVVEPL